MADINSYALELELGLQDNATKVLKQMAETVGQYEDKILKSQTTTSSFGESVSRVVSKATKAFNNVVSSVLNYESKASSVAAKTTRDAEEINELGAIRQKGLGEETDLINKENKVVKLGREFVEDFDKKHMKGTKKFQLDNLKHHSKIATSMKGIKGQSALLVKGGAAFTAVLGGAKLVAAGIRDVFQKIRGIGQKIRTAFTGIFSGIGLGEIAQAATLTGLFDKAILGAFRRQELFHTVNFRQIGTVKELNERTQDLALQYPITAEKIDQIAVSMRAYGATREEIDGLTGSLGYFERATGANIRVTSAMATQFAKSGGDIGRAEKRLAAVTDYAREFGFSAKDVDLIMGKLGQSAYYMGVSGVRNSEAFGKALLQLGASAKQMGLSMDEATSVAEALMNPVSTVAVLGPQSLNWDPEKRLKGLQDWAQGAIVSLQKAEEGGYGFQKRQQLLDMVMKNLGFRYGEVDKGLKMLAEGKSIEEIGKQIEETAEKDPEIKLRDALEEASTSLYDMRLVIDKTIIRLQKVLRPIAEFFSDLFQLIATEPVIPFVIAFGAIGLAVGTALIGVFGGVGAAIMALANPITWVIGAIGLVSAAILGITDAIGITDTGFGNLWNSIRIGGTGLATWMGGFVNELAIMWEDAIYTIEEIWHNLVFAFEDFGGMLFSAIIWVPEKIEQGFRFMISGITSGLNWLIDQANAAIEYLPEWMGIEKIAKFDVTEEEGYFEGLRKASQNMTKELHEDFKAGETERANAYLARVDAIQKENKAMFAKDAQDATGAVGFRMDLLTGQLGDWLSDAGVAVKDLIGQDFDLGSLQGKLADLGLNLKDAFTDAQEEVAEAAPEAGEEAAVRLTKSFDKKLITNMPTLPPLEQATTEATKEAGLDRFAKAMMTAQRYGIGHEAALRIVDAKAAVAEAEAESRAISAAAEAQVRGETKPRPAPLFTAKIDERTARTSENQMSELTKSTSSSVTEIQKMNENLGSIVEIMQQQGGVGPVIALLSRYLPEMAEGRRSGLAQSANQWT